MIPHDCNNLSLPSSCGQMNFLLFKAAGTVGWIKVKNDEKMFEAVPEELISWS